MQARPALATRLEEIAAEYTARFPGAADQRRVMHGLKIAKRPGQVAALGGGFYVVRSQSRPGTWYQVSKGACECEDFSFRGARCCHRWACALLARVGGLPDGARGGSNVPTVQLRAVSPLVAIDREEAAGRARVVDVRVIEPTPEETPAACG
jgi:hypothetical protein